MEYETGVRLDKLQQSVDMIIEYLAEQEKQKAPPQKVNKVVQKTIPPPINKKPVQQQPAAPTPAVEDDFEDIELEE